MSSFQHSSPFEEPRGSMEQEQDLYGHLPDLEPCDGQFDVKKLVEQGMEHQDVLYNEIQKSETEKLCSLTKNTFHQGDTFIGANFGKLFGLNDSGNIDAGSVFPLNDWESQKESVCGQLNQIELENSLRHESTKVLIPPKEKGIKKKREQVIKELRERKEEKGDDRKNVYCHSTKEAIKKYCSEEYERKVARLHERLGIENSEAAKEFYQTRQKWNFGLGDTYQLLNYEVETDEKRLYKKAFLCFYRWYFRSRYSVHVLRQGKIDNKEVYLTTKNKLVYLPEKRNQPKRRSRGVRRVDDSIAEEGMKNESGPVIVEVSSDSDAGSGLFDSGL